MIPSLPKNAEIMPLLFTFICVKHFNNFGNKKQQEQQEDVILGKRAYRQACELGFVERGHYLTFKWDQRPMWQ